MPITRQYLIRTLTFYTNLGHLQFFLWQENCYVGCNADMGLRLLYFFKKIKIIINHIPGDDRFNYTFYLF